MIAAWQGEAGPACAEVRPRERGAQGALAPPHGLSAIPAPCQAGLRESEGPLVHHQQEQKRRSPRPGSDSPALRMRFRSDRRQLPGARALGAVRGTGPGRHLHPPLVSGTRVQSTGHTCVPGEGLASAPSPEASQLPSPTSCQHRAGNHCKVISPSKDAVHHVFNLKRCPVEA